VLLDVADVDLSGFVLADEVDELFLDRVHPVHAAVLDLLLVDFGQVGAQQTQGDVGIAVGLAQLLLADVFDLLQTLLQHLYVASTATLITLRKLLAKDAATAALLLENVHITLFPLDVLQFLPVFPVFPEDAAVLCLSRVLPVLHESFELVVEEGVVGVVLL
jgi:hypothetical protein